MEKKIIIFIRDNVSEIEQFNIYIYIHKNNTLLFNHIIWGPYYFTLYFKI